MTPDNRLDQTPDGMQTLGKIIFKGEYDIPQIERTSRRLTRLTEKKPKLGRVLDIGCGSGLTSNLIKDRSTFIHGLDLDPERINIAYEKKIYDQLDTANILQWEYSSAKFDTIVSCMVSYLIPEFDKYMYRISSLLSDDGCAYIDAATCSGSVGERQLDNCVLRTRKFIKQTVKNHGLHIKRENIGPWGFSVGTYMEIMRT